MKRLICAGLAACFFVLGASAQDPPSRIARLNYLSGSISMQPAGVNDWAPAELNRPFTTGDTLYADASSRAEFHLDTAVIRAGEYTSFGFLTLTDQATQLRLTQGDLYVNLREMDPNQTFEVDTPNAAVSLLRTGIYRFRIASNGELTFVVVRQGQAEITGGGQAFNLTPGNSASISGAGSGELSYNVEIAPQPDDFDQWSQDRDAREARLESERYLPSNVVGYEDMDQYGGWQNEANYGHVWYPRQVVSNWAPYRYGHWAWIEPWGWTWVDDAPWGFAPFHYGRWAYISGRWGWCPGPIVIVDRRRPVERPVYAPALVAWFGGSHFGVSIGVGGGAPNLGWVPLGYGEVYTPSYHCSPRYFNNVNVSNTTVVKTVNITNVYNNVYVNKTVYNQRYVNVQAPNAVSAMPQNAFASGRPVSQGGVSVAPRQMAGFQPQAAAIVAPPIAPTRQATLATNSSRPMVAHPPAQVVARQVVVRNTPAVAPAAFANRQTYLQQHVGQPHDFPAMHQQVAPQQPATPEFRRVPAVTAATAQPHPQPQVNARPEPQVQERPQPQVQPRSQTLPQSRPNVPNAPSAEDRRPSPREVQPAPQPRPRTEVERTVPPAPHPTHNASYPARETRPASAPPPQPHPSAEKPKEEHKK